MSNKIVCIAIASILALTVVGCGRAAQAPMPAMESYDAPGQYDTVERQVIVSDDEYASGESSTGGANYSSVERLIIRNGSLNSDCSSSCEASSGGGAPAR